jgi:hypothetical protein
MARERGHPLAQPNDRVALTLLESATLFGEIAAGLAGIHAAILTGSAYEK